MEWNSDTCECNVRCEKNRNICNVTGARRIGIYPFKPHFIPESASALPIVAQLDVNRDSFPEERSPSNITTEVTIEVLCVNI
jgi:hypothetical protein